MAIEILNFIIYSSVEFSCIIDSSRSTPGVSIVNNGRYSTCIHMYDICNICKYITPYFSSSTKPSADYIQRLQYSLLSMVDVLRTVLRLVIAHSSSSRIVDLIPKPYIRCTYILHYIPSYYYWSWWCGGGGAAAASTTAVLVSVSAEWRANFD